MRAELTRSTVPAHSPRLAREQGRQAADLHSHRKGRPDRSESHREDTEDVQAVQRAHGCAYILAPLSSSLTRAQFSYCTSSSFGPSTGRTSCSRSSLCVLSRLSGRTLTPCRTRSPITCPSIHTKSVRRFSLQVVELRISQPSRSMRRQRS